MARQVGTNIFPGSLEVLAGAPLDARSVVDSVDDLIIQSNFPYPYIGMNVVVKNTGDIYTLMNMDVTNINNWKKQAGGGGGSSEWVDVPFTFSEVFNKSSNKVSIKKLNGCYVLKLRTLNPVNSPYQFTANTQVDILTFDNDEDAPSSSDYPFNQYCIGQNQSSGLTFMTIGYNFTRKSIYMSYNANYSHYTLAQNPILLWFK